MQGRKDLLHLLGCLHLSQALPIKAMLFKRLDVFGAFEGQNAAMGTNIPPEEVLLSNGARIFQGGGGRSNWRAKACR